MCFPHRTQAPARIGCWLYIENELRKGLCRPEEALMLTVCRFLELNPKTDIGPDYYLQIESAETGDALGDEANAQR